MLLALVILYLVVTIAIAAKRVKNTAGLAIGSSPAAGHGDDRRPHSPPGLAAETVLGIPAKFVNSGLNGGRKIRLARYRLILGAFLWGRACVLENG